ncbi:hypothetical protein ABPG74_003188 [Tetrahymena malaccensis]
MNSYQYVNKLKKQIKQTSTQGWKQRVNQKTSYINQIPLSNALERFPQFFDDIKISVVQKSINEIDRLPYKYNNIEILYLSNNNLTDLEGIQQFKKLRTLTLAHNELSNVKILRQISQLNSLEQLNLSGNPIAKHPNYKIYLLTVLPNLKSLDGRPVSEEARLKAEIKAKQQTQLLQLMLRNYCEIIKLNSFGRKIDLHREMIQNNLKFVKNMENKELNHYSFKNKFDFMQTLDEYNKNELQDLLLNDILTFYEQFQQQYPNNSEEDNYDKAFQEMIKQQNIKLAEIDVLLEKKVLNYNEFLEEMIAKFKPLPQNVKTFSPSRNLASSDAQNKTSSRLNFKTSENKAKQILKNSKSNQSLHTSDKAAGAMSSLNKKKLSRDFKQNNIPDDERDLFQKINQGNSNTNESFNPVSPITDNQIFSTSKDKLFFTSNTQQDQIHYTQFQEEQDILLGNKQKNEQSQQQRFNTYQSQQPTNQNNIHRNLSAENILYQRSGSPSDYVIKDRYQSPGNNEQVNRRNQGGYDSSLENTSRGAANNQQQQDSKENSPNRTIPQPSQYEIRPNHQDECCRKLMKSARNTSQDFFGKPTPYKRRNKELEEIVFELNKKLQKKEDDIAQLKQINGTIKEKLVEVNSSSENNLKKQQQEQLELMKQLEKNQNLNKVLDHEVKELRDQLNRMLIKNSELSNAEKNSIYYKQQQQDIQEQYDTLQQELKKKEIADNFCQQRILKLGFLYLKFSTQTEQKINEFRYDKKNERNQFLIVNCFKKMKRYAVIKKFSRVSLQEQNLTLYHNYFNYWKRNIIFQNDVQRMLKKKEQQNLAQAFVGWKQFIAIKERNQKEKAKVQEFYLKQLQIKIWRAMKQQYKKSVLSKKELDIYQQKATVFDNSKTKRKFLKLWKSYISNFALPYKQKQQNAIRQSNFYLLKVGFAMLVKNRKDSINNNIKVNKFIHYKKKQLLRSVFNFMSGPLVAFSREKKARNKVAELFIKKRLINTWKQTYCISRNLKRLEEKAKQFSLKKLVQRHFDALKDLREKVRKRNLLAKAVQTRRENQQKRISILKWFKLSVSKKSDRLDQLKQKNDLQRAYFKQWLLLIQQRVQKKQKQRQILNIADKKAKLTLCQAFNSWLYVIKRKIRNRGVVENMLAKKETQLLRISLFQFSKEQKLGLYKKLLQYKNNQTLLNADFKENQIVLETINEEKNEIVDKSRELMQQNILLQEHITEKNSEINQLKRQIQNLEKLEVNQEEVIKDLQQKISEQEMQIFEINNEYTVQMDQEENTQKTMRMDNKAMQREIQNLQKELDLKNSQLAEYERSFQNRTTELFGDNRDLQEKLQNSIVMANEFKQKIEQQDSIIANLENKIIELNENNQKQKEHITECVSVIQQFESTYDAKVTEYENIINLLNAQLDENKVQQEQSNALIEQLSQEVKKLEYEVSLLTEDHHASTNQFISSLYKSGQKQMFSSGGFNQNLNHSISSEADAFTLRKRQNYFTSPLQTDQNRRTASKDYKILQKSFERQRTQMKDKIQSLTQQIQNTLNSQGQEELLPQQDVNTNNKLNGSQYNFASNGFQSAKANQPQIHLSAKPQNKTSTATFFTDRRQLNQDKSYEDSSKFINLKGSGLYSNNFLKNIERKESPINSLKVTPKVYKYKNSSISGGLGIGINLMPNFTALGQSQSTTHAIRNDLHSIVSPSYNLSSNLQNLRPDSAKESRTQKSSVNDLSMINNTENILQELEKSKSGRKIIKNQLELRIKNLNDNLEQDIQNAKRLNAARDNQ